MADILYVWVCTQHVHTHFVLLLCVCVCEGVCLCQYNVTGFSTTLARISLVIPLKWLSALAHWVLGSGSTPLYRDQ